MLKADPREFISLEEVKVIAHECNITNGENSKFNYINMLRLFNEKVLINNYNNLILFFLSFSF